MTRWLFGLLAVVLISGTARSHFIWVIPSATGDAVAIVWSDSPRLGAEEPLKALNLTKVLFRHADGRVENLKGTPDKDAYRVACPGAGPRTLAVVRNRLANDKLITHIGRIQLRDPQGKSPRLAREPVWADLGLEILSRPDKGPAVFQVVYRGKPVEKAAVEVFRPGASDTDKVPIFQSDKDGLIAFEAPKAGRFGLMVEHEFDESGMHDGKPFIKRRYTSTLVIEYAAPEAKKSIPKAGRAPGIVGRGNMASIERTFSISPSKK